MLKRFLNNLKNFRRLNGRAKGLTLMELLVALGLAAVLILVATRTFTKVSDIQDRTRDLQNIEGDLRYAMNVFADEVKYAKPHPAADVPCGGAGCSNVYFCVTGSAPQVLWLRDRNNVCVSYSLVGSNLTVTRGGNSYTITSDDVSVSAANFLVSALGDRVLVQLRAAGSTDYNKTINYQTAITSVLLGKRL